MSEPQHIAVIGAGYVGLTTAACLAKLGHEVVAFDVEAAKIARLQAGTVDIMEDGLTELVQSGLKDKRLRFALSDEATLAECLPACDAVFLCVPTPPAPDGSADLAMLLRAVDQIRPRVKPGAIIVNKSTVPVGTADTVARALGRTDVQVVSNPEFLREGSAVHDFMHPDRVVVGGEAKAAGAVAGLYGDLQAPAVITDARTAELMKYGANAFLAMKLSFANAMASLSEELGANGPEVLDGIGSDNRIGKAFLRPGPGWGGSCFPKDTLALLSMADTAGYRFDLLREVIRTNDDQTQRVMAAITRLVGGPLQGKHVAVWGLSFKAGTSDLRESPAVRVSQLILAAGATIAAYDPAVTTAPAGITLARSALAACAGAEALVVLTEWPQFAHVNPGEVAAALAQPRVADARGLLDGAALRAVGLDVWQVGRGRLS